MATNPYYVVTGAPVTQSRGVSATIRSEYSAIHTGFDAVYVAMLLRGLKGGETWTGTHVFTGATVTFATQSASDNSTKAATTAYADGAVLTAYTTLNAAKANIASPTFTGTPAAPTAAAGTSTTQIATTEFVAATAFSSVLPGQTGNSGKFLTTNGTDARWDRLGLSISARTSDTVLGAADIGTLIDITSGTFTQTFTAAATLGAGWYCYIRNSGTGNVTLDPDGSETIDSVTTGIVTPGVTILIVCTGSTFTATRIGPETAIEVLTSGTSWTCPLGVRRIKVKGVGGGGSGGKGPGASIAGGGGGGGYFEKVFSVAPGTAYTYAIGAAGAAQTTGTTNGNSGGNTTFAGSVTCTGVGGAGGNKSSYTHAAGGTATNGDINIAGGSGVSTGTSPYTTICGGTPFSSVNFSNDPVGVGYGGGGGGTPSTVDSKPGQPGVIVLEY